MMYRVAICDDEINQCAELEKEIIRFFEERAEACEVEVWYDSESLCREIKEYSPEILFLDIELPENNGVYVGKYIRETLGNDRMNIVFISHKTSYALELFQIHPYDFLIKPVEVKLLYDTLTKILQLEDVQKKEFRYTFNKTGYAIPYGEILYFSSRNKTITIHKINGESTFYYGKLGDIVPELPFQFVCVSKSYIVNIKYIKSWKSDLVILENDVEISIAQSKRADFKKAIYNYGRGRGKDRP